MLFALHKSSLMTVYGTNCLSFIFLQTLLFYIFYVIFLILNNFSKTGRARDLHLFREAPNHIERARMFVSNLGYFFKATINYIVNFFKY